MVMDIMWYIRLETRKCEAYAKEVRGDEVKFRNEVFACIKQ